MDRNQAKALTVTWDRTDDVAYIYLNDVTTGAAVTQVTCPDADGARRGLVLDFDAGGVLLGIELMTASRQLAPALKQRAIDISS